MANIEQLKILKKEGVEAWNKWRKDNPDVKIDLTGVKLYLANLREAKLGGAILTNADLTGAILTDADLSYANLYLADLRYADLSYANLRETYLREANLGSAILIDTNLTDAYLARVQALGTNFIGTTITGACIQNWNINSETNLKNVICDYIYLEKNKKERRPSDPNRNFEPGEFAKLVEEYIETVDLVFKDGIDWQTFLTAFRELQIESESGELSVRAIEKKRDGAFVIRVDTPAGANKETIEASFWDKYQPLLEAKDREIKLLSEQKEFYSQQTESYEEQIEVIRKDNTRLIGIVETMVEKETSKVNMTFNAPVNTVAGNVEGNQNIYAPEQQTLAEAAAEIQKLLKQLKQTNPDATPEQQQAYVDAAIPRTLKEKCIDALQAGGETAIDEFFDNPFAKVGKAIVSAWIQP